MQEIHKFLQQKFPAAVLGVHDFRGDETVVIKKESLGEAARFLKDDPDLGFNLLMDLGAVDYLTFGEPGPCRPSVKGGKGPRFEIVYHLYSAGKGHRLRVKVPVEGENPEVPSLTSIWPAADWYEREVWDLFGIRFSGHPNLKRILMYEEFTGHPLRKDYPVNKRQPLIGPKN